MNKLPNVKRKRMNVKKVIKLADKIKSHHYPDCWIFNGNQCSCKQDYDENKNNKLANKRLWETTKYAHYPRYPRLDEDKLATIIELLREIRDRLPITSYQISSQDESTLGQLPMPSSIPPQTQQGYRCRCGIWINPYETHICGFTHS